MSPRAAVCLGGHDYRSSSGAGGRGAPPTEIWPANLGAGGFRRCAMAAGRGGTAGVAARMMGVRAGIDDVALCIVSTLADNAAT
jgi:hypothetical protein